MSVYISVASFGTVSMAYVYIYIAGRYHSSVGPTCACRNPDIVEADNAKLAARRASRTVDAIAADNEKDAARMAKRRSM